MEKNKKKKFNKFIHGKISEHFLDLQGLSHNIFVKIYFKKSKIQFYEKEKETGLRINIYRSNLQSLKMFFEEFSSSHIFTSSDIFI